MRSIESAPCPVVDSDRSWEVSIRNFRADISFKDQRTGQAVVDHFLIIQNYFPVRFKDRFLLSTCKLTCDKLYHAGKASDATRISYVSKVGLKHFRYLNDALLPVFIKDKHNDMLYRGKKKKRLISTLSLGVLASINPGRVSNSW